MRLNLADDMDRITYFLGRGYYDLAVQLLLDSILKPGDTFIDIGAVNVGMTMLSIAAARWAQQAG